MFWRARHVLFVLSAVLLAWSCATSGRPVQDEDGSMSSDSALPRDGDTGPSVDGGPQEDSGPPPDSGVLEDGCVVQTDQELCALHMLECGPLSTFDNCGAWRDISECGPCVDGHCESGSCVAWTYSWQTGQWGACSVSCGGGTQTRNVWCEREDGFGVADSFCSGSKPATSQSCNTQSCCTPYGVSHDACGDDGCGTSCGSCSGDRFCWNGYCVWDHGNNGSETCNTICAWGTSQCVGTSSNSCSTLGVSGIDCYCW